MKFDFSLSDYKKVGAFRNIPSIKEPRWFYETLVDPEEARSLSLVEDLTSSIDRADPLTTRPFQYGDINGTLHCFEKAFWKAGRFGSGDHYGVWYGGLEEETSLQEGLYWFWKCNSGVLEKFPSFSQDRKMFKMKCEGQKVVDLRPLVKEYPDLISKEDYSFCRKLGEKAIREGVDFFLSQSVRKEKGSCVSVFNPKVLKKEDFLYYFHYTIYADGRVCITRDEDEWVKMEN